MSDIQSSVVGPRARPSSASCRAGTMVPPCTGRWVSVCPGAAYAAGSERHLLNVRAAGMGVFIDQDENFVQHAARWQIAGWQRDAGPIT